MSQYTVRKSLCAHAVTHMHFKYDEKRWGETRNRMLVLVSTSSRPTLCSAGIKSELWMKNSRISVDRLKVCTCNVAEKTRR